MTLWRRLRAALEGACASLANASLGTQLKTLFIAYKLPVNVVTCLSTPVCERYGEPDSAVEGLVTLWRRLRAALERRLASPTERLLDDCLQLLEAPAPSEERRNEVGCSGCEGTPRVTVLL